MPLSSSNRLWDETSNSRSQSTRFYATDFQLVVLPITKVDRREERTFPPGDCELSRKVSWEVAFAIVVILHAYSKAVAITKPRFPRFQNGEYANTTNIGLGMIFCLIFIGWRYKLSAVGVQGSIPPIRGQKQKVTASDRHRGLSLRLVFRFWVVVSSQPPPDPTAQVVSGQPPPAPHRYVR